MPFHRQVRRVDLQQIAVRDDCLVFHLQCASERIEIGILGVVPGIAHRGGDDAGRGRCHERFDKTAACRIQRAAEILALGFHHRAIQIAYLTHRLGHTTGVADRLVDRVMRRLPSAEGWVVRDIGERPARPATAESAHAMADIKEERLALLFAVIADIDAGGDLLCNDIVHRGSADSVQSRGIDRLAERPPDIERSQFGRARQTAGMRGQDAILADEHHRVLPVTGCSGACLAVSNADRMRPGSPLSRG
jgi:hypothetical protein